MSNGDEESKKGILRYAQDDCASNKVTVTNPWGHCEERFLRRSNLSVWIASCFAWLAVAITWGIEHGLHS